MKTKLFFILTLFTFTMLILVAHSFAQDSHPIDIRPRTLRLIYFHPNDRPYRQEVVNAMKGVIRHAQTFYAEQMLSHGYEETTFRFETDEQGEPLIHIMNGQYANSHYLNIMGAEELVGRNEHRGKIVIANEFLLPIDNIYFVVFDLDGPGGISAVGGRYGGKNSGAVQCWDSELILAANTSASISLYAGEYNFFVVLHELGHAFGLGHDWRDGAHIMSYGSDGPSGWNRLSACAAEFLAVHPYFNPDIPIEDTPPPIIELVSPRGYPTGSTSVSVRLKVSDSDGIHQVLLFNPADTNSGGLKACQSLNGKQNAIIEFDYDGAISPSTDPLRLGSSLSNPPVHPIRIEAVDVNGDVGVINFELFDVSTRANRITTFDTPVRWVESIAFSPNGTILVAAIEGGIKLWDVASQQNTATFKGLSGINAITFSPDGAILAASTWNGTIKLWDVATQANIATFEAPPDVLTDVLTSTPSIAVSRDNTILASAGGEDSSIKLWDVASQQNIATFEGVYGINAITFSPDGTILATGTWETLTEKPTVKLWDVATQANIATFEGHRDAITSIAYSPGGTILASASITGAIKFWDVLTGHNIATFISEGRREVSSVKFSHDGARLASVADGVVELWETPPPVVREDVNSTLDSAINILEPTPPPQAIREAFDLDPFYQQWVDVGGFPVVASAKVNPYAVKEAAYLVYQMTKHRPDIRQALVEAGARLAVMATTENLTDIPENRHWPVPYYHTVRGRAIGGDKLVVNEETMLNYPGNPYAGSNSVFHEFGHTIDNPGLRRVDPGFDDRLRQAYESAVEQGSWKGDYTAINKGEYWAEGSESWFYPNGHVNNWRYGDTREALKARDPGLAALLTEVYGDDDWRYTLPETRLHQPHLQRFDPQNTPTFQYPPDAVALYEELLRDPESTGDGRWINLEPYPLSELPRLRTSITQGEPTEIIIGNFRGDNVLLVYSIGPDNTEYFRTRLRGDMAPFNTYVGHLWLIKDSEGNNLAVYRAEAKTGRVLFLPERCEPKISDPEDLINTSTTWNPGPKIEGPWLWMMAPTNGYSGPEAVCSETDWLAEASGGSITEQQVATQGAIAGSPVGNKVWTLGTISSTSGDNIKEMINTIGLGDDGNMYHRVAYGFISLDTPREQNTMMYVGSDDSVKVWLNGIPVHTNPVDRGAHDYQERFPVTLKNGKNTVLVAVYNGAWNWSGFFGFERDAVYTLSNVLEDVPPTAAWDVNQDGQTNILDLVLVAQHLGGAGLTNSRADVNNDGTVNILDLVVVAQHLGESTGVAAPPFLFRDSGLDPAMIQAWIAQAEAENDGSLAFRQGIENLQRLLASLLPEKTALLTNYPNPFNPETWIPYHLAEPADVKVRIYAADGALVRTLVLGHQIAGIYENRTRAAYWDGKNKVGESVASGVYFYTLTAGDFMTTRKMLIRK